MNNAIGELLEEMSIYIEEIELKLKRYWWLDFYSTPLINIRLFILENNSIKVKLSERLPIPIAIEYLMKNLELLLRNPKVDKRYFEIVIQDFSEVKNVIENAEDVDSLISRLEILTKIGDINVRYRGQKLKLNKVATIMINSIVDRFKENPLGWPSEKEFFSRIFNKISADLLAGISEKISEIPSEKEAPKVVIEDSLGARGTGKMDFKKAYDVIIPLIKNAKETLLIATPWISPKYAKELIEKAKSGVKVKLLTLPYNPSSKNRTYLNHNAAIALIMLNKPENLEVRFLDNLHAKLYIADNNTAVITSANLTEGGLRRNVEYLEVKQGSDVMSTLRFFQQIWERAKKVESRIMKG